MRIITKNNQIMANTKKQRLVAHLDRLRKREDSLWVSLKRVQKNIEDVNWELRKIYEKESERPVLGYNATPLSCSDE